MKSWFLPGILLVFCFGARPLEWTPDVGLVAYYTFNHCDARDDSNGGSDGVLFGDPGCHCGVEGNALVFDGRNDYVTFFGQVNRYFNSSDFTLSFYFRPEGSSAFPQSLLSKRAACDEAAQLDFHLDALRQRVEVSFRNGPYAAYRNLSPPLPGTEWVHVALVREGSIARTYVNGHLYVEVNRCSGLDIDNAAELAFSNSPCVRGGGSVRFRGRLDQLRVYDRALSPAQIAALYRLFPLHRAELDCLS